MNRKRKAKGKGKRKRRGKGKNKKNRATIKNPPWLKLPEEIWGNKCIKYIKYEKRHAFEEMCHHVVDRSQGELVDITLEIYGINKLLAYVSERSPKLKRLRIFWSFTNLVPEVFVEAVKKLSLLEELNLTHVVITTEGIDEALAIATYLPALHHLQLIGNNMTNEAILDGCPHLDLRMCKNVSLDQVLSSRISRQIN